MCALTAKKNDMGFLRGSNARSAGAVVGLPGNRDERVRESLQCGTGMKGPCGQGS